MKIDRRRALALLGLGAAAPTAASAAAAPGQFKHGVASGDPLADRVVLWSRYTPHARGRPIPIYWEVCADAQCQVRVTGGRVLAEEARDYTIKVDATGLKPDTEYWYRFSADGFRVRVLSERDSPIGRMRTLPRGPTSEVVLAVASCSLYPGGYFTAYDAIARLERVDAVLHLGDYIYEYGADGYGADTGKALNRLPDPPHECVTLDDYRRRHACHREDEMLQDAHARAAWIVTWDDHETANDSYATGAENHNPDKGEGDWATRKAAAVRAWYEWLPIREPAKGADPFRAWRSFDFGDLAKLIMTETRLTARSQQVTYEHDLPGEPTPEKVAAFKAKRDDPSRRMMGPQQEAWISRELAASARAGQTWQVIGNQVVMARINAPDLNAVMGPERLEAAIAQGGAGGRRRAERIARLSALGLPYNLDSWDGYPADRERFYDLCKAAAAHPIVLSGDSHVFWVNELWDGAGAKRVAAEFGTTGITSPGAGDQLKDVPLAEAYMKSNREVIHTDQSAKGFVLLTLKRETATGALVTVSTIMDKTYDIATRKTFEVRPTAGGGVEAIKAV